MHPLLVRDGQSAPYACCVLLFLAAANAGVDHSFCNLGNSVGLVGPRHRHRRHLEALRNLVVTVNMAWCLYINAVCPRRFLCGFIGSLET